MDKGKLINTETITVTHEIEYYIDRRIWSDSYASEEEMAEDIASDLNLKSGNITFENRYFEVSGVTYDGKIIYISQDGEYDMYGGPYTPKMETPKILVNAKNIIPKVKKAFEDYGWDSPQIDISRTDIWSNVV